MILGTTIRDIYSQKGFRRTSFVRHAKERYKTSINDFFVLKMVGSTIERLMLIWKFSFPTWGV